MKRFSGGFTLVEILVVLALIGVLAMVVVPNLGGLVGRGSEQAYNSDRSAIQAAVDSYYTDPTTRVDGARQYPTKSGSGTNPTYSAGTWSSDGGFIYFDKIIDKGYMSDAPTSAGYQNRVVATPTPAFGTGSYNWYADPSGRVKAWYWPTPTPTPGTPESGYKSGVFP